MASIYVVPTLETMHKKNAKFKTIELAIFSGARKVGEAQLILLNYLDTINNGDTLETFSRYLSEDMHLAFSALSQHAVFSCKTPENLHKYRQTPIVAYLARVYVYPEYRGRGYGKEFIQEIPDVIKHITLSYPIAIAVYISPQSTIKTHTGTVANLSKKDLHTMQIQMETMFASAGYIKPSKALNHKRCMVWTEGNDT